MKGAIAMVAAQPHDLHLEGEVVTLAEVVLDYGRVDGRQIEILLIHGGLCLLSNKSREKETLLR